ncbi:hypothetical protein F4703DRAFT_1798907 [Phycomyces blakesleeanus]
MNQYKIYLDKYRINRAKLILVKREATNTTVVENYDIHGNLGSLTACKIINEASQNIDGPQEYDISSVNSQDRTHLASCHPPRKVLCKYKRNEKKIKQINPQNRIRSAELAKVSVIHLSDNSFQLEIIWIQWYSSGAVRYQIETDLWIVTQPETIKIVYEAATTNNRSNIIITGMLHTITPKLFMPPDDSPVVEDIHLHGMISNLIRSTRLDVCVGEFKPAKYSSSFLVSDSVKIGQQMNEIFLAYGSGLHLFFVNDACRNMFNPDNLSEAQLFEAARIIENHELKQTK